MFSSYKRVVLYLPRYYELVETPNGILRKGREVLITGCYLRTAREGCGTPRLLPTEYLVILLDEVNCFYFSSFRNVVSLNS